MRVRGLNMHSRCVIAFCHYIAFYLGAGLGLHGIFKGVFLHVDCISKLSLFAASLWAILCGGSFFFAFVDA